MTFKDIEPNNIKVMESAIKNMLTRVGVCNVDVKISSINIYDGREMAVVETASGSVFASCVPSISNLRSRI